jgi:hypothetical protein
MRARKKGKKGRNSNPDGTERKKKIGEKEKRRKKRKRKCFMG